MLSYAAFGMSSATFDPEKTFVRSNLVSPIILASIRACISFYCFTTIVFGYSWQAFHTVRTDLRDVNIPTYYLLTTKSAIGESFSFFTWLTYWSLGFYFLVSSVHTFSYAFRQRTWLHDSWPRSLQLLHSLFYTTITCFPFLVTITFWGTMYGRIWPEDRYEQWINISVHGLNSLFAIVEIVLPATNPLPWTHISVLLGILSLYLGLAYLTRLTQGFYVYEWMNPAHGNTSIVLHIVAYTAAIVVIFVTVSICIWLRDYISGDRSSSTGMIDLEQMGNSGSETDEEKMSNKRSVGSSGRSV
jgi:hypothetical protein